MRIVCPPSCDRRLFFRALSSLHPSIREEAAQEAWLAEASKKKPIAAIRSFRRRSAKLWHRERSINEHAISSDHGDRRSAAAAGRSARIRAMIRDTDAR